MLASHKTWMAGPRPSPGQASRVMTIGQGRSFIEGGSAGGRCELAMTGRRIQWWRIARGLVLVACFLSLVLALGAAGPEQGDVRVQRFADPPPGSIGLRGEVRYSLVRADVTAILSYVPTSLSLTLRIEGRTPPVSLAEQASLLEPLLARFLQDNPKTPRITLFLADHAQIVARLAAVLGSCANWDGRTGRPVRGRARAVPGGHDKSA